MDFVRSLAVVSILLTHYNAYFIYMGSEDALKKAVISTKVANIYIGDFGVALFLIISGAALMYTYSNKLELKSFYKKRFMSIYPMFWIGYIIVFSYYFIKQGGVVQQIEKWKMILSVIGMDGYLSFVTPTFYLIGEWFLGFIVIIYIIFPLMRLGLVKIPILTIAIILGLYGYFMINYNIPFVKNIFLFIRLPEILFGMCFVKYIKQVKWPVGVICLIALILNTVLKPTIDSSFQMTYVGIAAFLFLVWISNLFENNRLVLRICKFLSKYSYAIFLTHHVIIAEFVAQMDLNSLTVVESYIFFSIICCVILVFSYGLYRIHVWVMKAINDYLSEGRTEG